ncbi:hypothetical protein ACJX0J_027955 [Zea mays]
MALHAMLLHITHVDANLIKSILYFHYSLVSLQNHMTTIKTYTNSRTCCSRIKYAISLILAPAKNKCDRFYQLSLFKEVVLREVLYITVLHITMLRTLATVVAAGR